MEDLGRGSDIFNLADHIAIVTGASSGLGRRMSMVLAANGAKVACIARRKRNLEALIHEISNSGGEAIAIEADVTSKHAIEKAFDIIQMSFGTPSVVVNNAGIFRFGLTESCSAADWDDTIAVNLSAVFSISQAAVARLIAKKLPGSIINISSAAGVSFALQEGFAAYAAAKAGVLQMTRAMARDLAKHQIRVNSIAPGYMYSEMTDDYLASDRGKGLIDKIPLGRAGDPRDLDGTLLLLASDAGRFITGTTLLVDGGHNLVLAE